MLGRMTQQDPVGARPDPSDDTAWRPATRAVRAGLQRSAFEETAEAIYLTSGYVFSTAAEAQAAFEGDTDHYIYSRYTNPTVSVFQERLRSLEGAEACYATASGMSAVFTALATLCGQGDRLVASRQLFGACFTIVDEVLPRWGVESVIVDGTDLDQWAEALSVPTAAVFFETPSNPMLEMVDIAAVSRLAHDAGAVVVVDNVFGTPVHSHPLEHGADVVVYSATKHIDGQGRALGGAILGPWDYIENPVKDFMRTVGPSLSPFNAWLLLKGLETLDLRVERMAANAQRLAAELQGHARLRRVVHPLLDDHPQRELVAAPDDRRRHHAHPRGGRRAGRGLRLPRRSPPLRHLQQPRRRQVAGHPPREHHAPPPRPGGTGRGRHQRRRGQAVGRAGGP